MEFIIEPKDGYNLDDISAKLSEMKIAHIITNTKHGVTVIKADMTFDEVCDLKDMAYCTHEDMNES